MGCAGSKKAPAREGPAATGGREAPPGLGQVDGLDKAQLIKRFFLGLNDGTAATSATGDCTFQTEGASPVTVVETLGMLQTLRKAFPDLEFRCAYVTENSDGSYSVGVQLRAGMVAASLPAMGTFPAVAFASMPQLAKHTSCVLPVEVAELQLSADAAKVAKVAFTGLTDKYAPGAEDTTGWMLERWHQYDEVPSGWYILYEWLGASTTAPATAPAVAGVEAAAVVSVGLNADCTCDIVISVDDGGGGGGGGGVSGAGDGGGGGSGRAGEEEDDNVDMWEQSLVSYHLADDHAVATEKQGDFERVSDDLMLKREVDKVLDGLKAIAAGMHKHVCFVAVDHQGYEVGWDRTPGTNLLFLKLARAKVVALRENKNDLSMLTTSVRKAATVHAPKLLAKKTDVFPVAGVVMGRYRWPKGAETYEVGYLAMAGADTTPSQDREICRKTVLAMGSAVEQPDGSFLLSEQVEGLRDICA